MDTAARTCALLSCLAVAAAGVTATPNSDKCPTTYYIHEYNVHTGRATDVTGVTTQTPLKSAPGLTGGEFVSRDHLYRERHRWQRRVHHLQTQLVAEKTKRLEQLDRFLEAHGRETGSRVAATNSTPVGDRRQKPQADRGENTLYKEDAKVILNKATTPERAQKRDQFGADERSGDAINALEVELLLNTFTEDFSKSLRKLTSELGSVRRKYLHVYRTNKRLSLDYQRLRQEVGMSKGQMSRLQLFQESEIQRLKWRLGNATEMWRNATASVEERVLELCGRSNGSGCPSDTPTVGTVKVEKIDPNVVTDKQREERRLNYLKEAKTRVTGVNSDSPATLAATASMMSSDAMVDAGIRVSMWYLDHIASQRPKDCSDIDIWTQRQTPVQTVYLVNKTFAVTVLCEDGWTLLQRNVEGTDYSSPRTWNDYKFGFGSLEREQFWIGLQYLSLFSEQDDYQLKIDMLQSSDFEHVYSEYAYFKVANERDGYRLDVSDNSGTAGDIFGLNCETPLVNHPFSTVDKAFDTRYQKVANEYEAGWWYPFSMPETGDDGMPSPCFSNLNHRSPWYCGEERGVRVATVSMKIKPNSKV